MPTLPSQKTAYTKSQLLTATSCLSKYTTTLPSPSPPTDPYHTSRYIPSHLQSSLSAWWSPSSTPSSRLLIGIGTWNRKDQAMEHIATDIFHKATSQGLPIVAHFFSEVHESEEELEEEKASRFGKDGKEIEYGEWITEGIARRVCELVFGLIYRVVRVLPREGEEDPAAADGGKLDLDTTENELTFSLPGEWSPDIFHLLQAAMVVNPKDVADMSLALLWAIWQVAPTDTVCIIEGFGAVLPVVDGLECDGFLKRVVGIVGRAPGRGSEKAESSGGMDDGNKGNKGRTLITTDLGGLLEREYNGFCMWVKKREEVERGLVKGVGEMKLGDKGERASR